MGICRVCQTNGGAIQTHKTGGIFGVNPLCSACKHRSNQFPVTGGPCAVCQTQVAAGWRKSRAGDSMVCTWCYPRKARGNSASDINNNKATSSPEILARRAAWEEAHVHANLMAVSDAGHRAPIDATPKVPSSAPFSVPSAIPSAVSAGATQSNMVQSCTAAQAAACKVAVVNHLVTMYNESQENPEELAAPPSHIETQIITRETDECRGTGKSQQAEQLPGQGSSSVGDKGLAVSVAEEHINGAPCHSPIAGSDHPNQPEDQEGNGRVFGRVPTAKRSRKRSSADVHQKGIQRQRRKSALPEDAPLQTPELAGVPKPRQYRDINTVTLELQVADRSPRESQELPREPQELPRKSQELSPAVGGQAQESTSADEEEEGATGLLTLRNSVWQQQQQPQQQSDQAEQNHHCHQAEQQLAAQVNHNADRLNQQKKLFQAQLDAQDVLLRESQQDAADKGEQLTQETAVLQALRLETESYLDLAVQQQEHIFVLEQKAVEQQQQAAQLLKQQQEKHQQQQVAAALKFKEKLSEMKQKRQVSIAKSRKSRENLRTLLANERAGAVRQQDMLERLAAAEVKLVKSQMSDVKSRVNRHLCKLQAKLRKNRVTPKQALEWDVKHLEAVLADPSWDVAQ